MKEFSLLANETVLSTSDTNFFNQSLQTDWGPKRDPLAIVIPITLFYALIFLTGVIGNISTCIVIARNKTMHTATNYYLFSLAISDLLLLVSGLPPEIYAIWSKYPYVFGEAFCVLQGFAAETSANATVLTITAFTVERYVAICHPFLSHTLSKLNRAIKFIVVIWIFAMCLAVPQAISFGLVYEKLADGSLVEDHCVCIVKRQILPHAFEISTFVFFVGPMTLIIVLYVLIGLQLHRSTVRPSRGNSVKMKHRIYTPVSNNATGKEVNNGNESRQQEEDGRKNFAKNAQATKHVVKMLVAVVVAFFICWAPFHAQRLLAVYGKHTSAGMIQAFKVLTYVSGVFYYLSTTVNPLLYNIMSHKFREAFKATYKQCFRRAHHSPSDKQYCSLSGCSSQLNSHSNTDSCSRQSSLRYLDTEMARVHDSRRPLVVSFRRKRPTRRPPTKHVTIFDSESNLHEALNNLKTTTLHDSNINEMMIANGQCRIANSFSYVEVHNLPPTHVCPLNECPPIEVFQVEQLKLNFKRVCGKEKGKLLITKGEDARGLIKSCTMPEISTNNYLNENKNFGGM